MFSTKQEPYENPAQPAGYNPSYEQTPQMQMNMGEQQQFQNIGVYSQQYQQQQMVYGQQFQMNQQPNVMMQGQTVYPMQPAQNEGMIQMTPQQQLADLSPEVQTMITQFQSQSSCWKSVAIVLGILSFIGGIYNIITGDYGGGMSSIIGAVSFYFWYDSSRIGEQACITQNYVLLGTANQKMRTSIKLRYMQQILAVMGIITLIVLSFTLEDSDTSGIIIIVIIVVVTMIINQLFIVKATQLLRQGTAILIKAQEHNLIRR